MHSRAKGRVKKLLKNFRVLWINPGCETVKRATVQYHSIFFFLMNINLQFKIKTKTKKDIHQASRHLRMPGTNLKTIKFNNI